MCAQLRARAAHGRDPDTPDFSCPITEAHIEPDHVHEAFAAHGADPETFTLYSLRYASVRTAAAHRTPLSDIRLLAKWHDERTLYS